MFFDKIGKVYLNKATLHFKVFLFMFFSYKNSYTFSKSSSFFLIHKFLRLFRMVSTFVLYSGIAVLTDGRENDTKERI